MCVCREVCVLKFTGMNPHSSLTNDLIKSVWMTLTCADHTSLSSVFICTFRLYHSNSHTESDNISIITMLITVIIDVVLILHILYDNIISNDLLVLLHPFNIPSQGNTLSAWSGIKRFWDSLVHVDICKLLPHSTFLEQNKQNLDIVLVQHIYLQAFAKQPIK